MLSIFAYISPNVNNDYMTWVWDCLSYFIVENEAERYADYQGISMKYDWYC